MFAWGREQGSQRRVWQKANLRRMARLAFDPHSRGARRLARTWLPQLERWRIRLNTDYVQGDHLVEAGDMIEVEAPRGRRLVERGAGELVGIRRASARESCRI